MAANYEQQITAFVDFLGFSEASTSADDSTRVKLLDVLIGVSLLRGEFDVKSTPTENGTKNLIVPAVSTFSDHIVISYPLQSICAATGSTEEVAWIFIISQLERLLGNVAAAALRIGFLVRGGITVGKLYHAKGIVFGEAMVRAFHLESRTAVYPRIILSREITGRPDWMKYHFAVARDSDGLHYLDYFSNLLFRAAPPGNSFSESVKTWFAEVIQIISSNLAQLETAGKLKEFSKWAWFARKFRSGLERLPPELLKEIGLSLDAITWPK